MPKTHTEHLLRQLQSQKTAPDIVIRKGDVSRKSDSCISHCICTISSVPRPDVLQQLL
ncbi:hypothetical protein BDR05DRAFT_970924, partial [Suillus weaverae]